MQNDSIKWGETYDIEASAQDADENPIFLDDTWQAAMRITRSTVGGTILINPDPVMTITGGKAVCTLDTGDAPWRAGTYVYDIRITDPDGNDQWSEPVNLILENRNAPNT